MNGLYIQATASKNAQNLSLTELIEKYKEERLKKRSEHWRLLEPIFENTQIGISLISLEGNFIEVNTRFCEICKRSKKEMQSITWQSITHPDFLQDDTAKAMQESVPGKGYTMPKIYIAPDNTNIPVIIEVNSVFENSNFLYYVVKAIDVKQTLMFSETLKKYL